MTTVSLDAAYSEACRLLGDQMVRSALLERALAQAEADRDEAGQRIVELTTQPADTEACCGTDEQRS